MSTSGAPTSVDSNWAAAAPTSRLGGRSIIAVRVAGTDLILVKDGEGIYAYDRACPHEQADLCIGHVAGRRLHCPRHMASFGLEDGHISAGWQSRDLRRYPVRIEKDIVWVDLAKPTGAKV